MRSLLLSTIAAAALVALAGCGGAWSPSPDASLPPSSVPATPTPTAPSPASPSPRPVPTLGALTLTRTGGIAGVFDRWVVRPEGSVTRTGRGRIPVTRALGPAERAALARLLVDPALWTVTSNPGPCADGFVWTLSDGSRLATLDDCGDRSPASPLARLIGLVERVAP